MGNCCRSNSYRLENKTEKDKRKHQAVMRMRSGIVSSDERLVTKEDKYMDLKKYQFPFENIILEGGGVKGLAYSGAIKLLEEIGMWSQIRRIAGTSAGAMTATLLCVGYTADEIAIFLGQNLSKIFVDHSCGYCSLLPNLTRNYGWNPGKRIYAYFGQKLTEKCGDPDITFQQVYEMYNKELCIIVTNVNTLSAEYCHVKTTPHMPVRLACRMSMAIPVMFQAIRYRLQNTEDLYVDGGLLCNFPIHCFDGWYLSLKPEDSFLRRVHPIKDLARLYDKAERFGTYNEKTLGFLLYSEDEPDVLQYLLEGRSELHPEEFPDTKLSKKRLRFRDKKYQAGEAHDRMCRAAENFLQILRDNDKDENSMIDRDELQSAVILARANPETNEVLNQMFGDDATVDEIFHKLDEDENEQITFNELSTFLEKKGVDMQAQFIGYQRREINSLTQFAGCVQEALLLNTKRAYVEKRDVDRTVGINTFYIGTTDFILEAEDRKLLIEQGRRATIAYLKHYIKEKKPPLWPEYQMHERHQHDKSRDAAAPKRNRLFSKKGETVNVDQITNNNETDFSSSAVDGDLMPESVYDQPDL